MAGTKVVHVDIPKEEADRVEKGFQTYYGGVRGLLQWDADTCYVHEDGRWKKQVPAEEPAEKA